MDNLQIYYLLLDMVLSLGAHVLQKLMVVTYFSGGLLRLGLYMTLVTFTLYFFITVGGKLVHVKLETSNIYQV